METYHFQPSPVIHGTNPYPDPLPRSLVIIESQTRPPEIPVRNSREFAIIKFPTGIPGNFCIYCIVNFFSSGMQSIGSGLFSRTTPVSNELLCGPPPWEGAAYCVALCLSVCLSVRPVIVATGYVFSAPLASRRAT